VEGGGWRVGVVVVVVVLLLVVVVGNTDTLERRTTLGPVDSVPRAPNKPAAAPITRLPRIAAVSPVICHAGM